MNKAPVIASFLIGAATGSIITYRFILSDKFKNFMQEFPDEKETDYNDDTSSEEKEDIEIEGEDLNNKVSIFLKKSNDISEDYGYIDYSTKKEKVKKQITKIEKPYVITPDEFGDIYEYETLTLFYFADGVVTDSDKQPLDDVDEIIGLDSLNHFGEYEEDAVYVRNDRLKADYEVLKDLENYFDQNRTEEMTE